jgi:hypothetical protein
VPNTQFWNTPYPEKDEDPYFEDIQDYFEAVDSNMYGLLASAGPLLGGGVLAYSGGILTWTEPFQAVIPFSGFYITASFGPDEATAQITLQDGDRVIINVPIISSGNVTAFVGKINGAITPNLVNLQGLLTIGIARNGLFYSSALTSVYPFQVPNTAKNVRSITGNTTVQASDDIISANATGGVIQVTLPSASVLFQGTLTKLIKVMKSDSSANAVTIIGTVNGIVNPSLAAQYQAYDIWTDGTNYYFG